MQISGIFRKTFQRFLVVLATVALLGTIISPTVGAATTEPDLEHKVSEYPAWVNRTVVQASPQGGSAAFLIAYHNHSNTARRPVFKDVLPAKTALIPGTTYLYATGDHTSVKQADTLTTTGIRPVTKVQPGATAFVQFQISLPSASQLACGNNPLVSRASATLPATGAEFTDTARMVVHKDCTAPATPATPTTTQPTPVYSCDAFQVKIEPNRHVEASVFRYTAKNGATLHYAGVDWGDGTVVPNVTTTEQNGHTYASDGTYTATAIAHFTVKGQDVVRRCSYTFHISTPATAPATTTAPTQAAPTAPHSTGVVQGAQTTVAAKAPATAPTKLVNTGAGSVWGIAALVALAATAVRFALLYRANRS